MGNKLILLPFLLFFFFQNANAQCPPSDDPTVHVVQKGETFYGISRAYGLSLDELYKLNGLNKNAVLKVCQTLKVKAAIPEPEITEEPINNQPEETQSETVQPEDTKPAPKEEKPAIKIEVTKPQNAKPFDEYIRQKGKTHIVQPGEELPLIARLYGYTEEYFREFNSMGANDKANPGMVLKSTHCECPTDDIPTFEDTPPPAPKSAPATEQEPEPMPEMEDPIIEEETEEIELEEPDMTMEETPITEETDQEEEPASETLPPAIEEDTPIEVAEGGIAIEETPTEEVSEEKEVMEAPKPVLRQLEDKRPKPQATPRTQEDEMRESAMVIEINNLRTNPVGYADILSKYIEQHQSKLDPVTLQEAKDLVTQLNAMGPMTPLRPDDCLFRVAQTHGLDEQSRGFAEHIGSDGSWPWDRVTKACGDFKDGSENLLEEKVDPREAVLSMLVDEDNTYRPNRKNLLRDDWRSIGVFRIGEVGGVPNNWVITFGK